MTRADSCLACLDWPGWPEALSGVTKEALSLPKGQGVGESTRSWKAPGLGAKRWRSGHSLC